MLCGHEQEIFGNPSMYRPVFDKDVYHVPTCPLVGSSTNTVCTGVREGGDDLHLQQIIVRITASPDTPPPSELPVQSTLYENTLYDGDICDSSCQAKLCAIWLVAVGIWLLFFMVYPLPYQ